VYAVLGSSKVTSEGVPVLGDPKWLESLLVHEFGHSYANPVIDAHRAQLEPIFVELFAKVEDDMRPQSYGSWSSVAYETLVRAGTILYLTDRRGPQAGEQQLQSDEGRAFLWLRPLVRALGEARQRPDWKGMEGFVPTLARTLQDWLKLPEEERWPPFGGPLNAAFTRRFKDSGRQIFVMPDEAAGDPASRAAADYARSIHGEFYGAKTPLRRPGEVGQADLEKNGLVLYGTPASNSVLAKLIEGFGWKVEDRRIALGARVFEGEDLALIACQPHHADPKLAVVIYTSAKSAVLDGINSVFHGGTDWLVARKLANGKFETVAAGNFPRGDRGEWQPLPAP
jgi:hypothetical protein